MSNLIKDTCKQLGITQKELAEKMGVAEGTVKNWSSTGNLPEWSIKFISNMMEKRIVEAELETVKGHLKSLKEFKKFIDSL
jgi:DNA-binding XRE family transcriptional regulator